MSDIDSPHAPIEPQLYDFLKNEIGFQRARKQEIFSWASSLLVAIIGGVIVLTTGRNVTIEWPQKVLLMLIVGILAGFSLVWIHVHWQEYLRARKKLSYYYDQIAKEGRDDPWYYDKTGWMAIVALLVVAIITILIPPLKAH